MTEIFINKAKACAVTGHRVLEKDFSFEKLKNILERVVDAGFDTFLVGMALGFDTQCFLALHEIRKQKPIKIIACVPCESQPIKFNEKQKKLYYDMLESADNVVLVSKEYTNYCMMKRNRYMVDNCSLLFAYLKRNFGGTYHTVEYAKKQQVQILNFD